MQADTPEGVEYGLEDGEIVTDEPEDHVQLSEEEEKDDEYDPLMAGNVEVFRLLSVVIIFFLILLLLQNDVHVGLLYCVT